MTLCPLFESINETQWCHAPTLQACNEALPHDAIRAAIRVLRDSGYWYPHGMYIEQLQALLPREGE